MSQKTTKFGATVPFVLAVANAVAALVRTKMPYNMSKGVKKEHWSALFKTVKAVQDAKGEAMPSEETFEACVKMIRDQANELYDEKQTHAGDDSYDYSASVDLKRLKVPSGKSGNVDDVASLLVRFAIIGDEVVAVLKS